MDLELHQKDVARLVGVSTSTITNWELGHAEPEVRHRTKLIDFLGYDPEPEPTTMGDRVRWHRRQRGLTQKRLAMTLGVDEGSVRSVEEGRSVGQVLTDVFSVFLEYVDQDLDLEIRRRPD